MLKISNCFFSLSAPLTDKPPKILFPTENKINNMELQLGKIIMGFPSVAVSHIWVVSEWREMDDFTNTLQHTSRHWMQINEGTSIWLSGEMAKEKQMHKRFPYMQIVGANVPKAVLSTMESPYGARAPYAGPLHSESAAFYSRCLSFLTWGSQWDYHVGMHAGESLWEWIVCLFFFCDSILLDFWAQSAIHMALAALWMANVSVMVKPIRQDREVWKSREGLEEDVTEREVWRQRQRRCNDLLSACLLSSIWCYWNASSSFEMLPRLAGQEWKIAAVDKLTGTASHVSLLTPMHEQVAHCEPLSYLCHYLDSPEIWGKGLASPLKLSHNCLKTHFSLLPAVWVKLCSGFYVCSIARVFTEGLLHFQKKLRYFGEIVFSRIMF